MKAKILKVCVLAAILSSFLIMATQAVYNNIGQFPIGIYYPPDYQNTTFDNYKLIKDMNATYVTLGNGIDDYQKNDAAITQAAANGLKVFTHDKRLHWTTSLIYQSQRNDGKYVSSSNPLGQTFKIPLGNNYYLTSVKLYIDPTNWSSNVTLTLKIYDSPAKTTLMGTSAMTGPIATDQPVFPMNIAVPANTTLYWELTSNSTTPVGWVCTKNTDLYPYGQAYENGTAIASTDFWFEILMTHPTYFNSTTPSNTVVDEIADYYKNNTTVAGYEIKDEPLADYFSGVFNVVERFRYKSPTQMTYVNLLPNYAGDDGINGPYGFRTEQGGNFLTSAGNLGQTFVTNSVTSYISTIQFYLDSSTWSSSEGITLKLWNSPSKTSLIKQVKKYGGVANNYPQFTLNATVSPNTSYYAELVHDGGGDNVVGWVVRSAYGIDWERGGCAYIFGTQDPNSDFWMTVNQNITARSYEDYVYRWAKLRPDFLMYDHYPFLSDGSFSNTYYSDLEIIRRQALKASTPFWSYIQACGINNSLRTPSANEVRYQVYTNLAYGCKGINYFLFWTPDISTGIHDGLVLPNGTVNTTLYNAVKTVNSEVLGLGPTLTGLTSQAVYHSGTLASGTTQLPSNFFFKPTVTSTPMITGYFTNSSGRKYIMVTNRDFVNSRSVVFTLNPKPTAITEVSKATGLEVVTDYNASTGYMTATFAPGEGRLYVMNTNY